ncbi:SIS domain-containing protein [Klebsiella variicola subsp. variicola]|nr:SIS domain-containing protein [Klebsiella variicola subsp. variicola]
MSEPTVNRFCRSLETRGFPDFKLHLAQSLAHGTLYVNRNVDEDDSVESYTGKIFESAMASLDQGPPFSRHVGGESRGGSADSGQKIAFFGLGSSAAVAHDAMNKFFRFNVPVIYSDDIVLQRMSCMNCDDDDVVVIISHTGRTKSLVELAQLARENDAMVIALTSAGTPWPGKPRSPSPSMCRKIPTSICRWSPVSPS